MVCPKNVLNAALEYITSDNTTDSIYLFLSETCQNLLTLVNLSLKALKLTKLT